MKLFLMLIVFIFGLPFLLAGFAWQLAVDGFSDGKRFYRELIAYFVGEKKIEADVVVDEVPRGTN